MIESFSPGVVIDGRTYYPAGWMWLLAFSRAGCEWAERQIVENEADFKRQMAMTYHLLEEPDYCI